MTFKIIWDKKASDEPEKLELLISRRIILKVKELAENPFSKEIKKLKGETSLECELEVIGSFLI
jgi:mRNA-degrading endonuclease RelE of RelBE toxin-antitoxin system